MVRWFFSFCLVLLSSRRLDLFSDLRAALQESESRSCKVSSGLPWEGHIRSFLPCLEHSQSMSWASSDSRREKDPNSWCEPGHKQGTAHQGLLPEQSVPAADVHWPQMQLCDCDLYGPPVGKHFRLVCKGPFYFFSECISVCLCVHYVLKHVLNGRFVFYILPLRKCNLEVPS